jgi:hypothetical protein
MSFRYFQEREPVETGSLFYCQASIHFLFVRLSFSEGEVSMADKKKILCLTIKKRKEKPGDYDRSIS